MTDKEARGVLGDVSAYLSSRAILENEMLAGHTFTDICNAIKTLEQQSKTSYISVDLNKVVKEATEKALDEITYEGKTIREWAEIIVKQQPSDDCISRQAVIDAIAKIHPIDTEYDCTLYDKLDVMYVLKDLPSVMPQPKATGHWIDIMVGDMQAQACDQCKTFYPLAYTGGGHRFCPNCGAKMEVEE